MKRVFFLFFILTIMNLSGSYHLFSIKRIPNKLSKKFAKKMKGKRFYTKKFRSFFPQLSYFYRVKNWIESYVKNFRGKTYQTIQSAPQKVKKPYAEHISTNIDLSASYEFITNQLQTYDKQYKDYDWKKITVIFSYKNNNMTFEANKTEQGRELQEAFSLLSKFIKKHRSALQIITERSGKSENLDITFLEMKLHQSFWQCFNEVEEF